jgi:hypothetical protein
MGSIRSNDRELPEALAVTNTQGSIALRNGGLTLAISMLRRESTKRLWTMDTWPEAQDATSDPTGYIHDGFHPREDVMHKYA